MTSLDVRMPDPASADQTPVLQNPHGLSRRTVLAGAGAVTLAAGLDVTIPVSATAAPHVPDADVRLGSGTDFGVRISPDGRQIALDLLGVLWVGSSSGGALRRLTSDLDDIAQPDWSPDGSLIAYQGYREGNFDLWVIRPDGSGKRRLTSGPADHREPRWSPDGRTLVFSSDVRGSYGIYTYDVRTGRIAVLAQTDAEEYEPAWSPDGKRVAFVVDKTRIDVVTVATAARQTLVRAGDTEEIHQPEFTPDGKDVVYHLFRNGENVLMGGAAPLVQGEEPFPFRVSFRADGRFLYTAGGRVRERSLPASGPATGQARAIGFSAALSVQPARYRKRPRDLAGTGNRQVIGIGSPVLSPDGKSVAFRALGDLWIMPLGGTPKALFKDTTWWYCDPDFSRDGTKLAYCTDRSGTLNVWVRDLATGKDTQVTAMTERAALSARWSPDGREIAFLDETGALWTVEVATGDIQRVFEATFEPGRPTWSKDGRTIALAAVKPYSKRYREGLSTLLFVDRQTGAARYVEAIPNRSLQTRGDDGPVWSPDGTKIVFALGSVLWVADVASDGTMRGAPRQITDEVSDAPSWAGDSATIAYLSNGRLRTIRADGRGARTWKVPLTWTNHGGEQQKGSGDLVIHAGRMWDGVSRQVRRDVDVVVRGQKIVAVEPHRDNRPAARRIDASGKFVMPGLIDIHHHREMAGYAYGNRQGRLWLAYGITLTRSPGSPAYHMCEEREAIQAGLRVGPRYLATGEAVDGPRIYYNFMRPTYSDRQLRLELDRAGALQYDLIKAYVRLPVRWHKVATQWSHRHGVAITSHYHYPPMAFGADQTEHIGATNRFGYSRTITNVGTAYDDVIDMFVRSGMRRTPTLFDASALYRTDTSLVTDERTRTLYPSWRRAALNTSVQTANGPTQPAQLVKLENQVKQIRAMLAKGGNVVSGTDAPIDHVAISLHMNLRAMVRFGMSPHAALVTATSATADFLGQPLGRIAAGKLADIVVVDGDPLARIEDAANVTHTVVGGRVHTPADLMKPYLDAGASPASGGGQRVTGTSSVTNGRPSRVRPAVPTHPSSLEFWWNEPSVLAAARRSCCDH
ncbi:amidohydrolase family protein [Nigerium massiliense]|uniref:amidohydrolase family protein n=1 Tax=Nigerium massiliense TaxID=1522317 RepID=UPI000AC0CC12|nr:amidohydrolase family protein [Nigerium massiliense]